MFQLTHTSTLAGRERGESVSFSLSAVPGAKEQKINLIRRITMLPVVSGFSMYP
jgi:hypothetical protein